uniref:Uncharacterized protein n=1 Tax=Rousettus aegyptiacus TaxID=9407 RepID=A0A7J8BSC4_ROUAE|nr:hypothetical protein HJG63_009517 [Rousettus aegyptiacus]
MRRSHDSYKHEAEREKPETEEDRHSDGPDPEGSCRELTGALPRAGCPPPRCRPQPDNAETGNGCSAHRQEAEPRHRRPPPALNVLSRRKDSNSPLLNGARSQEKCCHRFGANSITQKDRF